MASFMSNFFQSGRDKAAQEAARPVTPTKNINSFLNPLNTPQGSPSKKTQPPGAHDLPTAFDTAMSLNSSSAEADGNNTPVRLSRPQNVVAPLSPAKTNTQPVDDSSLVADDSVLHKAPAPGSPLKKQGQENTPPVKQMTHAALSRHQLYEGRERPLTPAKKFNTSRGLTAEEREILQRPSVRRLTNVTQLCASLTNCYRQAASHPVRQFC